MRSILDFISSKDSGVSTQEIQDEFKELTLPEIVAEINQLHSASLIDLFKTKEGLFYRRNTEPQSFSTAEEKIVYLLVKDSAAEGIWIKDIRMKSGLHQNLLTKLLKTLEQRLLIKSVKSIKQNRKVYMLYDAVPSDELGDGPWFTQEGELDTGFVDAIKNVVYDWIANKTKSEDLPNFESLPELKDVHSFILLAEISSVLLTLEDVKRVLDILVYERKVVQLEQKYFVKK